jgi:hypothetical protein
MKSLFYAGNHALFIVGATLIAAALVARHVLIAALTPEWAVGFFIVFIGGLISARSSRSLVRIVIFVTSGGVAWTIILAVMPVCYAPSIAAMLHEVSVVHLAIISGAAWTLILACLAEVADVLVARVRK